MRNNAIKRITVAQAAVSGKPGRNAAVASPMRAYPRRATLKQRATTGRALLLFCVSLFSAVDVAATDPSVSIGGERHALTVIAEDVSLRDVLEYIAHHQRLSVESYVPLHEPITISLVEQPLQAIITLLLRDYSFTLHVTHDDAGANKLWIYPLDESVMPLLSQADYFGVGNLKSAMR